MKSFIRNSAFGVFLSFTLAGSAGAYTFSMDSFTLFRSGAAIFIDNFDDGAPPPSAPNTVAGTPITYIMSGVMGPENVSGNGRLILDQSGAVFNFGVNGSTPSFNQNALLNTNTDNANTTNGLKKSMNFSVIGRFDFIAPALNDAYGIRLDDRTGGLGNDIIDLRVRNVGGTTKIQFRNTDQIANTQVTFELALALGHEQIDLELDHPTANTNAIFGRYRFVDGGIAGGFNSFGSTFDIFDGELFTRADINAAHILAVPEPGTLLLLGCGLIGLLARSRRR